MFPSSAKSATTDPLRSHSHSGSTGRDSTVVPSGVGSPLDDNGVATDMRVARLLCSRLCHDLAGASGAIHNGVELLSEDEGADPAALSLIAASAQHLNNRLAFYRVAFGLGGGAGRTMTVDEAKALAGGVLASPRVHLDWRIECGAERGTEFNANRAFPADEMRLALILVLIGADALPRGGTLNVRCAGTAAGTEVSVIARGARARLPASLRAAIDPRVPAGALTSRTVHGYLAAVLARRLGAAVAIGSPDPDACALTVSLPRPRQAEPIPLPAPGRSF